MVIVCMGLESVDSIPCIYAHRQGRLIKYVIPTLFNVGGFKYALPPTVIYSKIKLAYREIVNSFKQVVFLIGVRAKSVGQQHISGGRVLALAVIGVIDIGSKGVIVVAIGQ